MAERKHRGGGAGAGALDAILWVMLVPVLATPVVALMSAAWARTVAAWVTPAAAGCGFVAGALLVAATIPRRWWWVPLAVTALLGAALAAGVVLAQHGTISSANPAGSTLLGAYAACLTAVVPWLVFRAQQPWLGLVFVWVTTGGAWGAELSPQQVWWLVWLLAGSLLVIGLSYLRDEVRVWQMRGLERLGPVLWPSARAILTVSILVAVISLVPLGAAQIGALRQAWQHTPFGQSGPLTYTSPNGTPVAVLGAPLQLDAPDVASRQVVVAYDVLNGTAVTPPLLGATLDHFDGTIWTESPGTALVPVKDGGLDLPAGSLRFMARVTVYNLPRTAAGTPLLGFGQPLDFSIGTQARIAAGADVSPLTIEGWQATQPLAQHAQYTTTSAVLPPDATGTGTLPPDLMARSTQVPPDLLPSLRPIASQLIGHATTPAAQAQALLDAMRAQFTVDEKALPPEGTDAVSWFLQVKRGGLLVWTTTYILLGRSVGLPLRLAEGFLPGSYDPAYRSLVVRASDATVWAQLAIPSMGWLDLFPVSSDVTILVPKTVVVAATPTPTPRPTPTPQPGVAQKSPLPPRTTTPAPLRSDWTSLAVGLVMLLLVFCAIAALVNVRWRRFGAHLGALNQFFARIALLSRLAGIRLRASDTASQATAKVVTYVPKRRQTLVSLNEVYERMRYGRPGALGVLPDLAAHWRHLRGTFVRLVLTRPWRRGPTAPAAARNRKG